MSLKTASAEIFGQLSEVIEQLDAEAYARPLDVLSGNTIGKHVRHILEFFELLMSSYQTGQLNYDRRQRDLRLEVDPDEALDRILALDRAIRQLDLNRPLQLETDWAASRLMTTPVKIPSSYYRELLYNIEHAIHHMALIQVAVRDAFPFLLLHPNFGVAYSTVQYQTH